MNLKKYLKYLIIPIVIALLVVPMLLTGCSSGTTAGAAVQTPFDQLKARMLTVESKVSLLEVELAEVDLGMLESIGTDFDNLMAQFDSLVLAFDILQESLDDLTADLNTFTLQVGDIEQSGNETATGLASLIIALADLTTRVDQLEQEEPGEESTLKLTIVGSLPTIVNTSGDATFSIFVANEGASAASGQVVLQLNVQGAAASITSTDITGASPFASAIAEYSPSQAACTEITFVSGQITLASGQSKAYAFTLNLVQSTTRWWIPTLEIAN